MSDRHIFSDHSTLVARSLCHLAAHTHHLNLIPSLKVVYRANTGRDKVMAICGGRSGRERGTPGFVGRGLLIATVVEDVFSF